MEGSALAKMSVWPAGDGWAHAWRQGRGGYRAHDHWQVQRRNGCECSSSALPACPPARPPTRHVKLRQDPNATVEGIVNDVPGLHSDIRAKC